ncbi:general stress protein [Planctomycetes bacterium TBK1r]|uniref:General stress protein 17M-like domain-containing protein n=1 Tax=Stieleria magnilauensis TaxID=2527963 RepID=A0ABX5XVS9_9BACT|nr:hypothetical protein TBK1r_48430 [Planctomycetes bacterium TBK1r]
MTSTTTTPDSVVAIYDTHTQAEDAIKQLQASGIELNQLSIVGRDYHSEDHAIGYYNTGDRVKYWGKLGAFWGGIWGLLVGSGLFWLPGIGAVVVGGPLVAGLVAALENAIVTGGMSALGAAIYSVGIPKDSIVQYESSIEAGKFLVMIHGSTDKLTKAKEALHQTDAASVDHHVQA